MSLTKSATCETKYLNVGKTLIIGETSVMKTTFISYLTNYFNKYDQNDPNISLLDKKDQLTTKSLSHDQSHSQDHMKSKSASCIPYLFTDKISNKQYLFIDTPGLFDARDIEEYEFKKTKVIDYITKLNNFSSIIIILNDSITDQLKSYFQEFIFCLNAYIPDIILQNVIVILSDTQENHLSFYFNILNLRGKIYQLSMGENRCTQSINNTDENDWKNRMKQIKFILDTVDSFKHLSIDEFTNMKRIHHQFKSMIHETSNEINQILKIQYHLYEQALTFINSNQDSMIFYDNTELKMIESVTFHDTSNYNILCSNCNQICQKNCIWDKARLYDTNLFSHCFNNCSHVHHYYAKKTLQTSYKSINQLLSDLQYKYGYTSQTHHEYYDQSLTIIETKQVLEKLLKDKLHDMKRIIFKLLQICSLFDIRKELQYLIKYIENQMNKLLTVDIQLYKNSLNETILNFIRNMERYQGKLREKQIPIEMIDYDNLNTNCKIGMNHLKTSELIKSYERTTDHSIMASILNEINQRVQGKSIDPLVTANEIIFVNKILEEHKHKSLNQLIHSYRRLQQQINSIIKSDIRNILNVDSKMLIENFVFNTLIEQKETEETNNQHSSIPQISKIEAQTNHPKTRTTFEQSKSFIESVSLIGFSHLTLPPYPSNDNESSMPALPLSYVPIIPFLEDSSKSLTDLEPNRLNNLQNSSLLINNLSKNEAFMPPIEHSTRLHSTSHVMTPDRMPNNKILSLPGEDSTSSDNSHLFFLYVDACVRQDQVKQNIILEEFRRRCYGQHPMLVKENEKIYQEYVEFYQMKSIEQLLIERTVLNDNIKEFLPNDDIKFIDNIPQDLIIKASALNHVIHLKEKC